MNPLSFILYLILLVDCVGGTNEIKAEYDAETLRSDFKKVLDDALLNPNGTTIVKTGRNHISELQNSDCTQGVSDNLMSKCAHMTNEMKSAISIMYITCIMTDINVELPF